ncbi:Predicted ATP-dependent protease PIL, contains LON domain [Plasmopara halstedii]|uniref:Predicted ATP-dependent protease PIL, contains LON domain n=1 Tax=Plasmopara halstedii TaxID=4781 RepID=A0A0P1B7M4_PLAHL|nr:Predicted ATP-dependent protease PIL, contains LON domain [Plasmopara halstedii]CEG50202.1 Predicted ATP-dependent protease PIL, contains LON domain [Plasmopara halstedii]|eukprot:XP_024586571.1 Predicted ATP-dependent protease PIL, contains LON domain [Plasmopara halstedii]
MTSIVNGVDSDRNTHAYLGDLEAVDHRNLALYPDGKVLFPGDDLPLRMLSDSTLGGLRELLSNESILLAVLPPHQAGKHFGATVRVERFSMENHSARMTGAARQRFCLLQRLPAVPNAQILWGKVQILPLDRAQSIPFDQLWSHPEKNSKSKKNLRQLRSRQYPAYWGYNTYTLYDARLLVQKIQNMLLSNVHGEWYRKPRTEWSRRHSDNADQYEKSNLVHYLALSCDQQDPNLFAQWVAGNLPLDTTQRLELLSINSTVRLLRREIELLEQVEEDIFCAMCGFLIANTREIFSMTACGAAGGTFVNPGGHVFQVLTLRDVHRAHIFAGMTRSTEDSWFAGYAWSITHCNSCYQHLGWRFDRVDSDHLPATFFGFRRAALTRSRNSQLNISGTLGLSPHD